MPEKGIPPEMGSTPNPLKRCNDPTRPCWGFFQQFFGEQIDVPVDETEAFERLRELLQRAFASNPHRLFRMAVLGGPGNLKGRVQAFASHLKARGVDMEATTFSARDANDREDVLRDPAWRTAVDHILSRWVNLNETGAVAVPRKAEFKAIGVSSKEPIRAYLPNRAGVVPHLRGTTQTVLKSYYARQKIIDRLGGQSLDALMSARNLELTTEFAFAPGRHFEADDIDAAAFERELAEPSGKLAAVFDTTTNSSEDPASGDDEADAELKEIRASTPVGMAEQEQMEPESGAGAKGGEEGEEVQARIDRAEKESPEWPLVLFMPGYSPTSTHDEKKAGVYGILTRLKRRDADLEADWDTIIGYLESWAPEQSLARVVPELFELTRRHQLFLAGIRERKVEPAGGELAQLLAALRGVAVPENGAAVLHEHVARETVGLADLLAAELDPAEFDDPARPDYIFLCERNGIAPSDVRQAGLHQEMRELLKKWLGPAMDVFGKNDGALALTRFAGSLMRTWQPEHECLGAAICATLHELAMNPRMKAPAPAPAPAAEVQISMF